MTDEFNIEYSDAELWSKIQDIEAVLGAKMPHVEGLDEAFQVLYRERSMKTSPG